VVNYGMGGHYEPHYDHSTVTVVMATVVGSTLRHNRRIRLYHSGLTALSIQSRSHRAFRSI